VLDPSAEIDVDASGEQVVVTPDNVWAYMTSPGANTTVPIPSSHLDLGERHSGIYL
jgi:hypothetical protein